MPANRLRDIFIARINQLMSQYEESKAITHGPTIGAMREHYLKSFLRELLPPKFSPVSGFVADMHGHITPQLDMIFFDRSELPTISLVGDTVIVPYEIVLVVAEIKSTLKKGDLHQIKNQQLALDKMESKFLMASNAPYDLQPRNRRNNVGFFIMAFESEISEDELVVWVEKEMGDPAGICILKSNTGILSVFTQVTSKKIGKQKSNNKVLNDYDPLLTFIGILYRCLYLLLLYNSTMTEVEYNRFLNSHMMWLWEGYLSEFLYENVQELQSQT